MGGKGENSHTLNEPISWKFGKEQSIKLKKEPNKFHYENLSVCECVHSKGGNRNKLASEEVSSSNDSENESE